VAAGTSLQDVINNAVAPLRIKREFIEAEGDTMDVEADAGNIEVVGVVQPTFQQLEDGGEHDPLEDIRHLYRERLEVAAEFTLPKLDNTYNTVRGLRQKTTRFRELQRTINVEEEPKTGLLSVDDDRTLFNSNNFRLDKGRNVSCSFEKAGMTCVVCPTGTHSVLEGKDDRPVVFAIADQNFSANLPAKDGKDCIRVLRVEDGSLREITGEFVSLIGKKKIPAGSVVLLGSLTQPKLLCETREHYVKLYMARAGDGPGWCDDRQSFKLPISLSGSGRSTYKSRRWGARPESIPAFNTETEKYWISILADNLNKDVAVDITVDISFLRKGADIRQLEISLSNSATVVAGASNANRTAHALAERNIPVTNLARPGWKLTAATVEELVDRLKEVGSGDILVLHGLDANLFVSVDEDMSSRPPFKGRDGKFHSHGRLEVVSGYHLEKILDNIALLIDGCCGRRLILVMPVPRFWIACCAQARSASTEETDADRRRLLKELGRFKRAVINLISRKKMDEKVKVISPLDVIGVKDDLTSIEQIMLDTVHLLPPCYGMVADEIRRVLESWRDNKRKAPAPTGNPGKKPRLQAPGGSRWGQRLGYH